MAVDPADLADELPDKPVDPDLLNELSDSLGWHALVALDPRFEDRCTQVFFFDGAEETRGRAMGVGFEAGNGWSGEVIRESVTLDQWVEVNEIWAKEVMDSEIVFDRIEFEAGGETTVWEWDPDEETGKQS